MTSALRLLVIGGLPLAGCDMLSSLTGSGGTVGDVNLCRDYVAHMNGLESCLGLSYDPDNFCDGVQSGVDWGPYYRCLVDNTTCNDAGQASMSYDDCAPPLVTQSAPTPVSP
ncbi:MAG: hypothetical protein AAGA48_12390 [Myxococcota bacterium]